MLPINGSSDIKSSIIPYDYSSLSSFYSTGAYLGTAKHADKLENGALKDILSIDTSAPVPPWKIRQVTEGEIIDRVFSGSPLIDEDDPLFDRDDVDDNFKNLFALYKGLLRMEELTEYAKTSEGNDFATLLQRQYDIHVKEIEDFLEDALFTDLYVVPGLKTDKLRSTITIPPSTSDNAYVGNTVTTDTSTVISSLSASDSLTITVTKDYVDTDVVVNLSDAASLSLADIATQINSDLTTAGFSSTFSTKRFAGPSDTADSHYALQVDFASGEALSLAAGAAAESSAVYVAGRTGSGDLANGFLAKIDDLASADPSQIFYESIDSEYDTDFHMDSANGVAVDSKGNVYTVGTTNGNMEGQINVDGADVFLRKYDASGQLLFSRMLGSNESGGGFKVAVDSSDNVVISGQTGGALTQSAYDGGLDNFISKFGSEGEELWTRQLGPFATDSALDVTFDSSGNIYASGITYGAISSDQTYGEDADAYVTKLDSSGTLQFNRQYSAGGSEKATAVAVNSSGDIFIAGMADANGFLRKYDSSGNVTYTQSLGSVGTSGDVTGISLDSNGDAYVSGFTTDTALDSTVINAHSGDTDGFVLHVDDQGASAAINWVTYVGTTSTDKNFGVVADTSDNSFYVTGSTSGTLSGETSSASTDAFMAKFTSAGALSYTHQFGGGQNHQGFDIAFDANGSSTLSKLGLPGGPIPVENSLTVGSRTTARADQTFYVSVNGSESKVTIESDDTFGYLAFKINSILGIQGRASLEQEIDQRIFQIEALNGANIGIRKGPGNFDALPGLGLKETNLFGKFREGDELGELSADDIAFGLGFVSGLKVTTTDLATEALTIVENAMREVRKAYKFITEGPDDEDDFKPQPQISEYDASRIAAYQGALAAVSAMNIQPLTATSLKL